MNQSSACGPKCMVVVPCYNEAERLDVPAFQQFTREQTDVRFVFVNDGSTDDTRGILERLSRTDEEHFTLLNLERNQGKAEAVRLGINLAADSGAKVVGFWDADLATPLAEIPGFLAQFEALPDLQIVLGSRVRLLGRRIERRVARHYLGRVFATVVSWMLGLPVYDTQCGAKMFRVSPEMRSVFERPFLSRWIFDVEVLARWSLAVRARESGWGILEVPLREWRDVPGSKLRMRDFFRAALGLVEIHRAYLRPRRHGGPSRARNLATPPATEAIGNAGDSA